jgi:uncharacterized membrane protein YoaK (UPF0700 family)
MNPKLTLVLASVAGFADTATFLKISGLFSAHVTGNFVLLALALNQGWGQGEVVKVIAFGVFALGAIVTTVVYDGLLAHRNAPAQKAWLLATEGTLLLAAAAISLAGRPGLLPLCGLLTVLCMSIQNVFHRVVPNAPMPSTVMTLNFTQSMIDATRRMWRSRLVSTPDPAAPKAPFFTPSWYAIAGFMIGCAFGALAVHHLGLAALVFPSVALVACALWIGAASAAA